MDEEQKKNEEGNEDAVKAKPKKKAKASKKKKKSKKSDKADSSSSKKTTKKKKTASKSVKVEKSENKPEPKNEVPVTFTEKKHKEKKKGGNAGLVLFVLLVIVLLAGAFYRTQQVSVKTDEKTNNLREDVSTEVSTLKDKLQNLTQQIEDQKREREEEKRKQYTVTALGLKFMYPAELGDVTEEILTQAEGEDLQESLMLTFSGNPDIWLSASTAGYLDETGIIYTGETENLRSLCPDPLAVSENGYCDFMNIMGQQSIEQAIVLGGDSITNIVKSVPVNISGEKYTGLTVNVSLGLPPVSGRNLFAPTTDDSTEEGLEEFLRNVIKEDNLSLVTIENLNAFEEIVTTLQKSE